MVPDIDVKAIRRATGMTRADFAAAYQLSFRTVQDWKRGAKHPSGLAKASLYFMPSQRLLMYACSPNAT